jgi:hypothetical protein
MHFRTPEGPSLRRRGALPKSAAIENSAEQHREGLAASEQHFPGTEAASQARK